MKVILHKLFPYAPYLNEYIGFEDEQRDGETNIEAVARLRKDAEQAHRERYPELYQEQISLEEAESYKIPTHGIELIQTKIGKSIGTIPASETNSVTITKDEKIKSFIATINYCTNKKFLENFRKRVEEENSTELTEAYNNKLKEFGG